MSSHRPSISTRCSSVAPSYPLCGNALGTTQSTSSTWNPAALASSKCAMVGGLKLPARMPNFPGMEEDRRWNSTNQQYRTQRAMPFKCSHLVTEGVLALARSLQPSMDILLLAPAPQQLLLAAVNGNGHSNGNSSTIAVKEEDVRIPEGDTIDSLVRPLVESAEAT